MDGDLAEKIIGYLLGGVSALIGLVWFMLRLYIKTQIHDLKDWLVTRFDDLHEVFEGKEPAKLKYESLNEKISNMRGNGRH